MNTDSPQEEKPKKRVQFWRNQFSETPTKAQIIFDVVMGIIVPILCLIFDPGVFRGDPCSGGPVLGEQQFFAYTAVALGTLMLAFWLITRLHIKRGLGLIAGVFFAGALFALSVGIPLVPMSIFGILFVGLGLLGFTPFLAAFVYLRNGVRAWRQAQQQNPSMLRRQLLAAALAGAFLVVAIPALVQWQIVPRFFPALVVDQNVSCPDE